LPDIGKRVTKISYRLRGVKVLSFARVGDAGSSDEPQESVPVFPLLKTIGRGCFENCLSLEGMEGIPESVTSLPSRCFAGCPFTNYETRITGYDENEEAIEESVRVNSVDVPAHVTSIASDCFTFDDYMEDGRPLLEEVHFYGRAAADVRAMPGFPFGIPPGCTIYAGPKERHGQVYTEPLPS